MKPIIQKIWMVMTLICFTIPTFAYDLEVDGIYYNIIDFDNQTCEVTKSPNDYSGDILIPDSISVSHKTFIVSQINVEAFSNCTDLKALSIPGTINTIPYGMFSNCSQLNHLELRYGHAALRILGKFNRIFGSNGYPESHYEGGLWEVPLSSICINRNLIFDSVETSDGYIEISPFVKAVSTSHYWNPANEKIIGYCPLHEVNIGDSITVIPKSIFKGCRNIRALKLGNNIIQIQSNSFSGYYLNEIYINTIQQWCQIDFQDLPQRNAQLIIANNPLSELIIDNKLAHVKSKAFYQVKGLERIKFDANISIGDSVFYDVTDLKSILFDKGKIELGKGCFADCGNLNSVTFSSSQMSLSLSDYCFAGCLNLNKIISNRVLSVGNGCFSKCTQLCEADMDSLQIIGEKAFYGCEVLSIIKFNQCRKIGQYAFGNCSGITNINLPAFNIEKFAFSNCVNLKSVDLPQIITINENAFDNCNELSTIKLGLYVGAISPTAFNNCDNISKISILNPIPPQFNGNFSNNTYLNGVLNIPSISVEKYSNQKPWSRFLNITESEFNSVVVNNMLFGLCKPTNDAVLLPSPNGEYEGIIDIPEKIEYDSQYYAVSGCTANVFEGCEELTELSIPKTFGYLPNISECKNLITFNIKNAILACPEKYFKGLINLENINLGNNILDIGNNAFDGCLSLKQIIIPGSCYSIGNDAFKNCFSLKSISFLHSNLPLELGNITQLNLSSSITPFPNPSDVDERRTGFRNGYYDGLFYGLPIERLVINRNIELPKYYERTIGNPALSYSTVYNDIVYYPPFYGLANLKYVEIGENVSAICKNQIEAVVNAVPTAMEYTNFGKCDNIEVVVSNNPNAPIGGGFSQTVYENASLFLPNGGESSYVSDDYWKQFTHISESTFIPVTSISFESEELTLNFNEIKAFEPIINPEDASIKKLKWSSSNPNIVDVTDEGIITTFARNGEATITASTCDGTAINSQVKVVVQEGAGIADISADRNILIFVENGMIHISGKSDDQIVKIFNLQGQLIRSCKESVIDLQSKGIYIIKVGSECQKVVI